AQIAHDLFYHSPPAVGRYSTAVGRPRHAPVAAALMGRGSEASRSCPNGCCAPGAAKTGHTPRLLLPHGAFGPACAKGPSRPQGPFGLRGVRFGVACPIA